MATWEEVTGAAKRVCPSSTHPGWDDLIPVVRFCNGGNGEPHRLAYMINKETGQVWLVGAETPCSMEPFQVSARQGRILQTEVTPKVLDDLEGHLNKVADERDGNGDQTENALAARDLLDRFAMERRKGLK